LCCANALVCGDIPVFGDIEKGIGGPSGVTRIDLCSIQIVTTIGIGRGALLRGGSGHPAAAARKNLINYRQHSAVR
jgi:hypothetical protein